MGSGLIILVAKTSENENFHQNPKITFFKTIYLRYVNFSVEPIPLNFNGLPNFDKKISCKIGLNGDLIGQMFVEIELPNLKITSNDYPNIKFNYIPYVGFRLIREIELIIGGQLIDRRTGEYLLQKYSLKNNNFNNHALNKMVGNVDELILPTNEKDSYLLTIPIDFWFCENTINYLPIISLYNTEVIVNVYFESFNKLINITPNHYLTIEENLVFFKQNEIIYQLLNGDKIMGYYQDFDVINNNLFYNKIKSKFLSNNYQANTLIEPLRESSVDPLIEPLNNTLKSNYIIYGDNSQVNPISRSNTENVVEINVDYEFNIEPTINYLKLLTEYIFLEKNESDKYKNKEHIYLITQLQYDGEKEMTNNNLFFQLKLSNPVKEIYFRSIYKYLQDINQWFNYNTQPNNNTALINKVSFIVDGNNLYVDFDSRFFSKVLPYYYYDNHSINGLNVMVFSLSLSHVFGSFNFSKVSYANISVKLNGIVNSIFPVKNLYYAVNYNYLIIKDGKAGVLFSN
jgi:hypothetical protein